MSRLWFAATTLFAMVALSALLTQPLAQQAPAPAPGPGEDASGAAEIRALRADAVAVRLMLGVGDAQPQAWDGKVTIDQGEIVALEGGSLSGRRCRDRPRLVEGPQHRSAQGHAAKAKAQAEGQRPRRAKQARLPRRPPWPSGPPSNRRSRRRA